MFAHRTAYCVVAALVCITGETLAQDAAKQETSANPIAIAGHYRCEGDGYKGSVTITKVGETYQLKWQLGTKAHVGVAIRRGDILASSWSTGRAGAGIVLYSIELGPKLVGKYSGYPGNGRTQTETLTFLKGLAKLPAPRVWQVKQTALVNWSRDIYWYPATVAKKDGDRYFVRFDDGDEEWTNASRMMLEDIAVGDRVLANWQGKGRYYPGTVTTRDGKNIHIKYDDGDEETTTISVVRVLRPKEQ